MTKGIFLLSTHRAAQSKGPEGVEGEGDFVRQRDKEGQSQCNLEAIAEGAELKLRDWEPKINGFCKCFELLH